MIRVYAALALVLLAGVGVWYYGHTRYDAGVAYQQAIDAKALAKAQATAATITERVVTQYVDRVRVVRERAQTIVKKVPVYVTAKADAACLVPAGFVRVHDAAVQGVDLPASAGTTADTPSGVALSAVASTVASNYGICRETAERLTSLQNWVRQQGGVKPDPPR